MEVVQMVLNGQVNPQIVSAINTHGNVAVGLSGEDGRTLQVTPRDPSLGFVGDIEKVRPHVIEGLLHDGFVPVLSTVGVDSQGQPYNVNADTAAGAIATATKAKRLLLLTDVAGVLDKDKNLISELSIEELPKLIENGTITGGMIPKVESAAAVVESGVEGVIILDGRVPHSVLLELLTPHGVGTRISRTGV
jgi:acetylglutamate kinase